MKDEDYEDRVLIKLRREYGKDELVAALELRLKKKDIEIGMLKSEIDYLSDEVTNLKESKKEISEINKEAKIKARADELYKIQLENNSKLQKIVKKLREDKDELICKIVKLQKNG